MIDDNATVQRSGAGNAGPGKFKFGSLVWIVRFLTAAGLAGVLVYLQRSWAAQPWTDFRLAAFAMVSGFIVLMVADLLRLYTHPIAGRRRTAYLLIATLQAIVFLALNAFLWNTRAGSDWGVAFLILGAYAFLIYGTLLLTIIKWIIISWQ